MENIKIVESIVFILIIITIVVLVANSIINFVPKRKVLVIKNYSKNNSIYDKGDINLKILNNFITKSEAKHIIRLSNKRLKNSNIIDDNSNKSKSSNVRTSKSAFFKKSEYQFLKDIE